jgi:hypothetical protein
MGQGRQVLRRKGELSASALRLIRAHAVTPGEAERAPE